jgi:nickel-dependent lactate racemase
MSAAAQIVRPGGAIVIAAECWDGVPDGSPYDELLRSASSPQELLEQMKDSDRVALEQWQVQLQAQIQSRADVYVYSSYLSDEQVQATHFSPVKRIEDTLEMLLQKYGLGASMCVIPEGPLTIPYISG